MITPRNIYYHPGNTSILARDMGKALLSRFPDPPPFSWRKYSSIRHPEDTHRVLDKIISQSGRLL